MHKYRTHKCNELRIENVNDQVKLSGWVHRKRDHGQLIFVDLRDHYGLTQVVVDSSNKNFSIFESLPLESVITVSGIVVERSNETINDNLPTGKIEINLSELEIISQSKTLPLQVNSDEDYGEETRLKFRYLDLRRSRSAVENIIPNTTGAPKIIEKLMPEFEGKLDGIAFNVPVPNGSCVDMTTELEKVPSPEEVNAVLKEASNGKYKNFIGYTDDPIVSSDVIGREETMVFDSKATMVTADNLLKTLCWYDNGWGFSKRILDTIKTYHKDV